MVRMTEMTAVHVVAQIPRCLLHGSYTVYATLSVRTSVVHGRVSMVC